MSSIYVHLPSLKRLKRIKKKYGVESLINRFSSYDVLVGSVESTEYLRKVYEKYKEEKL